MTAADPSPSADRAEAPRWIEVDGRRWRATDPAIPAALRAELVDELMDARRAIGALGRGDGDGDADAGRLAHERRRVQAAKVALGERGEPWWEPPTKAGMAERIEAAILALASHRAPTGSICPSDAARAVGGESWRAVVPVAQAAARRLARAGEVVVTQRNQPLDPHQEWRGPIRIRRVVTPPGATGGSSGGG